MFSTPRSILRMDEPLTKSPNDRNLGQEDCTTMRDRQYLPPNHAFSYQGEAKIAGAPNSKWVPGPQTAKKSGLITHLMDFMSQIAYNKAHTLGTFKGHQKPVLKLLFSPDNIHLFSASQDQTVRLWLRKTHQTQATFAYPPDQTQSQSQIQTMGLVPNKTFLYVYTSPTPFNQASQGTLHLWNYVGDYPLLPLKISNRFDFSPSKELLAYADDTNHNVILTTYHQQTPTVITLKGHETPITQVKFSKDGAMVMASAQDGSFRMWDVESQQQLCVSNEHQKAINQLKLSADGRWIATTSLDGTLRLWDAFTGQPSMTLDGFFEDEAFDCEWVDPRRLLTIESHDLKLWDLTNQSVIGNFNLENRTISALATMEHGRKVLVAFKGSGLIYWVDMINNHILAEFGQDKGEVNDLIVDADAHKFFACNTADHTFTEWCLADPDAGS